MFAVELAIFLAVALVAGASPAAYARHNGTSRANLTAVDARFDGRCFYPKGDEDFELESYLGRWYQVAASRTPFGVNCTCVFAEYSANDNGTVNVFNQCEVGGRRVDIRGTASPVSHIYGETGVFRVEFPGQRTTPCPGPNYIVQEYEDDWAIVQSANFSTMFLLSRQQIVPDADINAWLEQARKLGTNLATVEKTNQTGCLFS